VPTMIKLINEWPPERVEKLRELFNDGVSFAHIASQLALTRNAIIGKCARLGLRRDPPLRPKAPFGIRPPRNRSVSAQEGHMLRKLRRPSARLRSDPTKNKTFNKIVAGPKVSSEPLPSTLESDLAIPRRQRKNIFTLGPTSCRFPIGTPGEPDFFFCGASKLDLLPYCGVHARRCFVPARL
jgi:GcrA cell cycle regulator